MIHKSIVLFEMLNAKIYVHTLKNDQ